MMLAFSRLVMSGEAAGGAGQRLAHGHDRAVGRPGDDVGDIDRGSGAVRSSHGMQAPTVALLK